jgi:hypothetical protein
MAWLQSLAAFVLLLLGSLPGLGHLPKSPSNDVQPVLTAKQTESFSNTHLSSDTTTQQQAVKGQACSDYPTQVDAQTLATYDALDPGAYTSQNGWDIVSSSAPADAPFVNYGGTRELGACGDTAELVVDSTPENVVFCGVTYRAKRVTIAGVDIVQRIADLAAANRKDPQDPPRFWSPNNVCDAVLKQYPEAAILGVHVFPPAPYPSAGGRLFGIG